jgi:hypothetical protein
MQKMGYLGLLGIPLALLGVVTSVALAAPATTSTPVAPVSNVVAPAPVTADTDVETNDDASVSTTDITKAGADGETNDDASGPQETPGTEHAD